METIPSGPFAIIGFYINFKPHTRGMNIAANVCETPLNLLLKNELHYFSQSRHIYLSEVGIGNRYVRLMV